MDTGIVRTVGLSVFTSFLLAACGSSPTGPTTPPPPSTPPTSNLALAPALRTTLQFTADPGSPVARGLSRTYTLANAIFQSAHTNAGKRVQVLVQSTEASEYPSTYWSLVFDSPSNQLLVPGTFSTARPGQTTGHAFEFSGTVGGGCGSSTGTITIHEIMGSGGVLQRFHASFTYACTGAGPIVGEVIVVEPAR